MIPVLQCLGRIESELASHRLLQHSNDVCFSQELHLEGTATSTREWQTLPRQHQQQGSETPDVVISVVISCCYELDDFGGYFRFTAIWNPDRDLHPSLYISLLFFVAHC